MFPYRASTNLRRLRKEQAMTMALRRQRALSIYHPSSQKCKRRFETRPIINAPRRINGLAIEVGDVCGRFEIKVAEVGGPEVLASKAYREGLHTINGVEPSFDPHLFSCNFHLIVVH